MLESRLSEHDLPEICLFPFCYANACPYTCTYWADFMFWPFSFNQNNVSNKKKSHKKPFYSLLCLKYKKFCQSQVLGSFRQSSIVLTYRMFEFYTKWSRFRSVSKISATQHLCQFCAMFKGISLAFMNSSSHLNTSQNVLYYIKFD